MGSESSCLQLWGQFRLWPFCGLQKSDLFRGVKTWPLKKLEYKGNPSCLGMTKSPNPLNPIATVEIPSLKLTKSHLKIWWFFQATLSFWVYFQRLWAVFFSGRYSNLRRNHVMPMWVFPKIGIPQNGWFIMETPIKMDDLGGKPTIFGNTYVDPPMLRRIHWTSSCWWRRPLALALRIAIVSMHWSVQAGFLQWVDVPGS